MAGHWQLAPQFPAPACGRQTRHAHSSENQLVHQLAWLQPYDISRCSRLRCCPTVQCCPRAMASCPCIRDAGSFTCIDGHCGDPIVHARHSSGSALNQVAAFPRRAPQVRRMIARLFSNQRYVIGTGPKTGLAMPAAKSEALRMLSQAHVAHGGSVHAEVARQAAGRHAPGRRLQVRPAST